MKKAVGRLILIFLVVSAGFLTSVVLILHKFIAQGSLKPQLEMAFSSFLQRNLTIEELGLGFFPMPGLVGRTVRLYDKDGEVMAESPVVEITPRFDQLFRKKLRISQLSFVEANATLRRREDKTLPLGEMINDIVSALGEKKKNPNRKPSMFQFETITIEDTILRIQDETIQKKPLDVRLIVNAEGEIEGKPGDQSFPFQWKSEVLNSKKEGQLYLSGSLDKNSSVQIKAHDIHVSVLKNHFPKLKDMEGNLHSTVVIAKTEDGVQWSGQGSLNQLHIPSVPSFPVVTLQFNMKKEGKADFDLNFKNDPMKLHVKATNRNANQGFVMTSIEGEAVNLEKGFVAIQGLLTRFQRRRSAAPAGSVVPMNLSLQFDQAYYKDVHLDEVHFKLRRSSSNLVQIHPIKGRGHGGELTASATFYPTKFYQVQWDITEMDIEPILKSVVPQQRIRGRGRTRGMLFGPFGGMDWKKINGTVELELKEGSVSGVPGLIKSFSQLNIQSLLSKRKEKGQNELSFDKASATLKIQNGIIELPKPGLIENKTLQVSLMGSANLNTNQVDGKLVFNFLTVAGEILKAVPGIKQVFYNNQKSFAPIWVSVKGPFQNPTIKVLPIHSITETLWGTISNVIRFPFKSVKSLNNSNAEKN